MIVKKRFCKNCNSLLSNTSRKYRDYCNSNCRADHTGIGLQKINCQICDTLFTPRTVINKVCSDKCRNKKAMASQKKKVFYFSIFQRDNFTCIYCGKSSIEDNVKLNIDHIIPIAYGGLTNIYNLITACKPCNTSKNKTILSNKIIKRIVSIIKKRNEYIGVENVIEIEKEIAFLELNARSKFRLVKR